MLKKLTLLMMAAAAFALGPWAVRLGPAMGAVLLIGLGVGLAVAASGTIDALAIAAGALGAFAASVLAELSPATAGAVLLAASYAERTVRVRGPWPGHCLPSIWKVRSR